MKLTKLHGCGNDSVVVDGPAELPTGGVREICDRGRGVGADGSVGTRAAEGRCWPEVTT
jgi:diaminopimelate epimerase